MRDWMMILATTAALALAGCAKQHEQPAAAGKPVIVATIQPVASLVQQIVGDGATVRCLIPAGVSPHGFEPTARDVEALHGCAALVRVGMNFDDWADAALRRVGGDKTPSLALGDMVHMHQDVHAEPADHHDDHDDHDHHDEGPNPHIWLDPLLMAQAVGPLGDQLAQALPDDAETILRNAQALSDELEDLDAEFRVMIEPFAGVGIVTFHDAFDRLAARYSLVIAATLSPGDAPGAMTPKRMEKTIKIINQFHLKALFAEPQFPSDAADAIRAETGVTVMTLDPIGDPHDKLRDTYQNLMRYNVHTLVQGLSLK